MLNTVKAYLYGVRDGWEQPHYLSTSKNVDHLGPDLYDILDRGINLGQFLRAGLRSQAHTEYGYPFNGRNT